MAPLAYFLTFHTYGTWLHGREGTVDAAHNRHGDPTADTSSGRERYHRSRLPEEPLVLGSDARRAVRDVILEVCRHRLWEPHAVHVRSTHVHAVLTGPATPEKMTADLKAYATRRLKLLLPGRTRFWAEHGSTVHLWDRDRLDGSIRYVLLEQGEPMARHPSDGTEQEG